MHQTIAAAALVALLAVSVEAQSQPTAAELLQKGIYAQETSGDLETAAKIYRQIVDSHPVQREIAAQAQYRLGMTLLQKGDAALASQEIQRLGWDFPDYKDLIASAKRGDLLAKWNSALPTAAASPAQADLKKARDMMDKAAAQAQAPYANWLKEEVKNLEIDQARHDSQFDFSKTVTASGTVSQMARVDSYNVLTLTLPGASTPPVRVSLDPVSWSRGNVKVGDQVTVVGAPSRDGSSTIQAVAVTSAGHEIFSRTVIAP